VKNILFGVVGWNIAETSRMIEIAKRFQSEYNCHFFSYGGQFEHLVTDAGFVLHHLEPQEDEKKIEHLWKIDRGEKFQQPWSYLELEMRILNELALIDKIKPYFAFLGSVLSFSLSCRIRHIRLFNVVPLALSKPYLQAGLPIDPFSPKWVNRLMGWILLNVPLLVGNFQRISRKYNLPKIKNALDVWSGDINIVTDIQSLSLLKELPKNWYFSGPLFAHLPTKIPNHVLSTLHNSSLPLVYFAMGSSANREILLKILSAFDGMPVSVIAPIKSHLKPNDQIPSNVTVTDWLPALEVIEKVAIAVTHGGQGTVQTTVMAGKPFLGIGMQPEQALNIYPFVQFGNALQLPKKPIKIEQIRNNIQRLLRESTFTIKAKEAQKIYQSTQTLETIYAIVREALSGYK
jgi:UDP:flavonoid glycosyltransferase YjiC (YdhE family)